MKSVPNQLRRLLLKSQRKDNPRRTLSKNFLSDTLRWKVSRKMKFNSTTIERSDWSQSSVVSFIGSVDKTCARRFRKPLLKIRLRRMPSEP